MSYFFVYRPSVKADVKSAFSYYKSISPDLSRQFLSRIREAKINIARSPTGFQVKYKTVRMYLVKQFPYQIHYFVDDTKEQIIILAIVHAYRNPGDYSNR